MRPPHGIGTIALALVFGLFNPSYGIWMLVRGIELRRTGTTLHASSLRQREQHGA